MKKTYRKKMQSNFTNHDKMVKNIYYRQVNQKG